MDTNSNIFSEEELSLKLFIVLSRAHNAVMEHAQRDIRRHGLNPTEFGVLELLYNKGPQPLQHIGDKILLSSGSITYVVDKLEEKEFLYRQPCAEDRRVTFATISDKGKKLLDKIFPEHIQVINNAMNCIGTEEKKKLIVSLKKLGTEARKTLE